VSSSFIAAFYRGSASALASDLGIFGCLGPVGPIVVVYAVSYRLGGCLVLWGCVLGSCSTIFSVLSNCRSPVSTIIVSRVLPLGASELVSGLIGAEGVLCSGSPVVIITSLVSSILGASIGLNTVTTSPGSSSF
jgi:hypothetical protein